MKRIPLIFLFCLAVTASFSQIKRGNTYATIPYDSSYGFTLYEKLNFYLGGDSMRYDPKGYSSSGWYEDYWQSGQLLHRGYYVEGHLKFYKNYFESGQLEREFKSEFNKASMIINYPNGKPRAQIDYMNGNSIKETDYYDNGQTEFSEEYDKEGIYISRNFFYESGKPQSSLAITDEKKKLYDSKEYFENGGVKEQGQLHYSKAISDFQKEGKWQEYDSSGKLIAERVFSKGEMSSEKLF